MRLSYLIQILASVLITGLLGAQFSLAQIPLQTIIDGAEKGAIIVLKPGVYDGPIVIRKSVTLDGAGKATIDAHGKGTVITIKASGVTVQNLRLIGSGDQHNDIDAGITIEGNFNVIKNNIIEECLFGVSIQQSNNNVIRRNKISSKSDAELGTRGDSFRLWYSRNNIIEENIVTKSRDFVVWYSADNIIKNNNISDGRYGLHFMYSRYNLVEDNTFLRNSTGIFLMYSDSVVLRGNHVFRAQGAAGVGIGFKEASNLDIFNNEILYNGVAMYLDVSPFQPDTTNRIYRNTIAFNDTGVMFLNDWKGNEFMDNRFMNNIRQVAVSTFATANRNIWQGNFWDDYEGFDLNKDGIGDRPYRLNVYADRLGMDVPHAAFFRGTPVLGLLDFMEKLAPFTEPMLMLEDKMPRTHKDFEPAVSIEPRANKGQALETFGLTTAEDKAGTSMNQLDPFGILKDERQGEKNE